VSFRTYECILMKTGRAHFSDKIVFREATRFTFDLDLDEDMEHTKRAALLTGILQVGGQESDISQYRLTVAADGKPVLTDWAAGPGFQPAGALADCSDEELVHELMWRLQNRS
jgi:hypothetical protein